MLDLTHLLDSSTQIYPGDPPFHSSPSATIIKDGYNVLHLHLGTHTGTHIDAPSHTTPNGRTIDEVDIDVLVGKALVIDVSSKEPRERIVWRDVKSQIQESLRLEPNGSDSKEFEPKIVLFRTGWSKHWKTPEYFRHPYLDGEIAEKLLRLGVKVIGVDTLNPDRTPLDDSDEGEGEAAFDVHRIWLGDGGLIVENLTNLDLILEKEVMVSLLPLNIAGGDGSPIRAVAWPCR